MEETKKKAAVKATAEETKSAPKLTKAEEKSKATTLRIISIILWVLAIGFEVLAILTLLKALYIPGLSQMWWMIIFIVLDLVCCIVASQLWKKASFLDPFKKTGNKVTVDMTPYVTGVYFVRVHSPHGVTIQKVIKER